VSRRHKVPQPIAPVRIGSTGYLSFSASFILRQLEAAERELRAQQERLEAAEQELLETLGRLVTQGRRVERVLRDPPDPQVLRVRLVRLEPRDKQEQQGKRAPQVPRVQLEPLDLLAGRGKPEEPETLEEPETPATQATPEAEDQPPLILFSTELSTPQAERSQDPQESPPSG
jgi:hypothetical protein